MLKSEAVSLIINVNETIEAQKIAPNILASGIE
jgi:hypothetical protein